MFFGFYDPTIILVFIGAGLSLWASANVKLVLKKYQSVRSSLGITAAEAAKRILNDNGIYDVTIRQVSGVSSDYYDPKNKQLCLLDTNYNSTSIGSIGVAAHECGHAIQDATDYLPLRMQMTFAPVANIGTSAGFFVIFAGLIFAIDPLVSLGLILFFASVVVTIILLPVEYNASNRALAILGNTGMLTEEELKGAKKVLRAAGLTYVAAAAASILSFLRLVLIFGGRGRRRD